MIELTDAKRRIVERLKRVDSATATELALEFELTDTAVRQHLEALETAGLVHRGTTRPDVRPDGAPHGRGRPAAEWQLTPLASGAFPDRHADLSLELIESIRASLGEAALQQVITERSVRQLADYHRVLDGQSLPVRVRRFAERRTAEGYVAEVRTDGDDLLLIEHHCPIGAAAASCQGLCRSELEVFQAALGDDVDVRREQHLLSGDQRCSYRITRRT